MIFGKTELTLLREQEELLTEAQENADINVLAEAVVADPEPEFSRIIVINE